MKIKKRYTQPVIQVYKGYVEPYLLAGTNTQPDEPGTVPPTTPGNDDGQGPYADSKRSYFDFGSDN